HSAGKTSAPPRTAARGPVGLLGAMPGWVSGAGLAIKAVTVFPDNVATDRPSHQGVIVLFDDHDGAPLCVMDGEHITAMRTAGAAAVSVRLLAKQDARVLAILGSGAQGRSHLATVPLVHAFTSIRVASRNREHAEKLAALDSRCVVAESMEAAVRDADVVCCCTDARQPIVQRGWLEAGAHLTSVGGTFGPEIPADLIASSRVFVEWRGAAQSAPPAGAHELQDVDPATLTELGEILNGTRPGRASDNEITVYKSTGVAFEDTVVARLVYDDAVSAHVGLEVDLG
ncbi:MAG: ornithine cyclodeaminase family protein, partial [Candidatus Dormibacteraeota bacterium]|nr:ornithine cyclodeaminase family protein [Candidatus Dormibacteraeota bacterium]